MLDNTTFPVGTRICVRSGYFGAFRTGSVVSADDYKEVVRRVGYTDYTFTVVLWDDDDLPELIWVSSLDRL